jgi:biopolymer transport protein ExbD
MALDLSKRKGWNVELNIVPFIDLMSCLTAFLLVTAAWVNTAALDIRPQGKTREGGRECDQADCMYLSVRPQGKTREGGRECDQADCMYLSVLVEPDAIWVGQSRINELDRIPTTASGPDFAKLGERLRELRKLRYYADMDQIEVAVESSRARPMSYQAMVGAMDTAVAAGFRDVGISDPNSLTTRPTL